MLPSELEYAPSADIDLMMRFYKEEPWGAWRDNIHAALIAREVHRGNLGRGQKIPPLTNWILAKPEEKKATDRSAVFDVFRAMSGGIKAKGERLTPKAKKPKVKKAK